MKRGLVVSPLKNSNTKLRQFILNFLCKTVINLFIQGLIIEPLFPKF